MIARPANLPAPNAAAGFKGRSSSGQFSTPSEDDQDQRETLILQHTITMSPVTFDRVMTFVNDAKTPRELPLGGILKPSENPEVKFKAFFDDLNRNVQRELFALMALGQEATEQIIDRNAPIIDRKSFGTWTPQPFEEYRYRSRGFMWEYFYSKPLDRYLPLARQIIKIYGLKTYEVDRA